MKLEPLVTSEPASRHKLFPVHTQRLRGSSRLSYRYQSSLMDEHQ